jgi:hypothetical protein
LLRATAGAAIVPRNLATTFIVSMSEMNSIHEAIVPSVANGKGCRTKTCCLRTGFERFADGLGMHVADFSHHEVFQPFPAAGFPNPG